MNTDRTQTRGRPRTIGYERCDRCGRDSNKTAAIWPDGRICGICFYNATHTYGTCPGCNTNRMLPGRNDDGAPICVTCAGIRNDFTCAHCGEERARFRKGICARCAVTHDLTTLLHPPGTPPTAAAQLIDILAAADRPESIYTWMRNPAVQTLLTQLGNRELTLDHPSLDTANPGRHVEHLRAILVDNGLLPYRDPAIARFERWIDTKLETIDPSTRRPVERFAKWHHLRHIRKIAIDGISSQAAVHNAKQEITEALKFVLWLTSERHHTLRTCSQADINLWLATGPTTRSVIRTFIVFASKERLSPALTVPHRQGRTSRNITHEERLTWITRCLDEEPSTLPVRAAALLLLLYAQPLIRVATLPLTAIDDDGQAMHVRFDTIRVYVPDPFASILREHLTNRAPARTRTIDTNPWLFPGGRAGEHITHSYLMNRIRNLGINLLGTRNRTLNDLVMAMPAPVVADTLGYSYQVTTLHAAQTGVTFAKYAGDNH